MTALVSNGLFWGLTLLALGGALAVVFVRDIMRMALGLGAFFLAVAGFFAYYGFGFLALAELFVYVGGVLVLILFALMLVQRTGSGAPVLDSKSAPIAAASSGAVSLLLFVMLLPLEGRFGIPALVTQPAKLAETLLGSMLPQFEAVGVLLLVSLVAVVVIVGGDRR